jgi:S1/P1 Nuclease
MDCFRVFALSLVSVVSALAVRPALAWNSSTHMITGSIAYHVGRRENPSAIPRIRALMEQHPWYETRWRAKLSQIPEPERDERLFMLAVRWADDIRSDDRAQNRGPWHYINFPFKPKGEPPSIEAKPPALVNILSAIAENQQIVRREAPPKQQAISLAWLFHLVGDVHQPLHTAQLFTREYPDGDRGGNEICVRVEAFRTPMNLHTLWDGLITSTDNVGRLRRIATGLRTQFRKTDLTELANSDPAAWAKESYGAAVDVAYQNGALRGTPQGQADDCRQITGAAILPSGYLSTARSIADRRIVLAGYRLAALLGRMFGK